MLTNKKQCIIINNERRDEKREEKKKEILLKLYNYFKYQDKESLSCNKLQGVKARQKLSHKSSSDKTEQRVWVLPN